MGARGSQGTLIPGSRGGHVTCKRETFSCNCRGLRFLLRGFWGFSPQPLGAILASTSARRDTAYSLETVWLLPSLLGGPVLLQGAGSQHQVQGRVESGGIGATGRVSKRGIEFGLMSVWMYTVRQCFCSLLPAFFS